MGIGLSLALELAGAGFAALGTALAFLRWKPMKREEMALSMRGEAQETYEQLSALQFDVAMFAITFAVTAGFLEGKRLTPLTVERLMEAFRYEPYDERVTLRKVRKRRKELVLACSGSSGNVSACCESGAPNTARFGTRMTWWTVDD